MSNLEGEKPPEEVVEPTPKEGEKPTPLGEKPTVGITETEEFRQALDKALGKGLESTNRQLSLQRAAAESAKADAEQHKTSVQAIEAELQDLQRQHDDLVSKQFAEDPEARQAYIDKRTIADGYRKLAKKEAELAEQGEVAALDAMSALLQRKAIELSKETGIEVSELDNLDEVSMVEKALRFQRAKEPEVKESKFDSALSSGGGGDWRDLSSDEKLTKGLSQKK